MLKNFPTKSERREKLARQLKIKAKKGGTLGGQLTRTQTAKNYLRRKVV